MALIATDQGCKFNGSSTVYNRTGARKHDFQSKGGDRFKTVKMQPNEAEYSTDGLPKAFLHSLRTLFDILDDGGQRGYVHISEIESRWQGGQAGTQDLPGGVLECLRRVAPPHGCLTFERFVAGLRYSMLNPENRHVVINRTQAAVHPQQQQQQHQQTTQQQHSKQQHLQKPAPLSACNVGTRIENKVRPLGPSNGTNTTQHRASSLQSRTTTRHEVDDRGGFPAHHGNAHCGPTSRYKFNATGGGFERSGRSLERIPVVVGPEGGCGGGYSRSDQNQIHHVGKQQPAPQSRVRSIESLALESPQLQKPSVPEPCLPRSQSESAAGFITGGGGSRRHLRSREEQRRHTISNGVDYGMLKQMKELEQEKDSLLTGLEVVERARDWYQGQIHNVTERQRQVGQSNQCMELFTEASQSRINVLLPKLQEVNRCLSDLISCSGMPVPQSTNLSTSSQPPAPAPPQAIQRLKDQNRLLTQEVTEKSERITQLEQEKSALIKQLFEARARSIQDTSAMDSTFI